MSEVAQGSAVRIASAHRKLMQMAEEFEESLQHLLRGGNLDGVDDQLVLRDKETGTHVALRIQAGLGATAEAATAVLNRRVGAGTTNA